MKITSPKLLAQALKNARTDKKLTQQKKQLSRSALNNQQSQASKIRRRGLAWNVFDRPALPTSPER
ncbi:hypothetical protein QPM17_03385 [Marinobacter sp. TBZ242]|uniref:Uncharacterized protein n=1 Tax=Marinobacter azerbaijanicus TaxID=3050455 RepID=A0ABT7I7M1_9GAMM|nr:hypothetical protein [Marinobacter sp. TBZ242]MDL0430151.1 hypothetical protein [Marinobacter sp. TBZ242]